MSDRCVTQESTFFSSLCYFKAYKKVKQLHSLHPSTGEHFPWFPGSVSCAQHLALSCLPIQAIPSISIQSCRAAFPPDPPFVSPRYICLPDSLLRQSLLLIISNRLLSLMTSLVCPPFIPLCASLFLCSSCCTQILLIVAPFPGMRYELYSPAASSLW